MKRDWAIIRILAIDYGIRAINHHLTLMVEGKIIDRAQPFYLEELNSIEVEVTLTPEWEQRVLLLKNEDVWAKVLEMCGDEYGVVICSSSILIGLLGA